MHPLMALNPACSSLKILLMDCLNCCSRTLQMIFPSTDKRLIPLQLPHIDRSPFLGSFMMIPFFQVSGTFSSSHTSLKSFIRALALMMGSAFNMYAVILSSPGSPISFCLPDGLLDALLCDASQVSSLYENLCF